MGESDDGSPPRPLRRSGRERKENRAWTPSRSLSQEQPGGRRHRGPVDPNAETQAFDDSELQHSPIQSFERSPPLDDERDFTESESSESSKNDEELGSEGEEIEGLEDEGADGVLGEELVAAEKEFLRLKAKLVAAQKKTVLTKDLACKKGSKGTSDLRPSQNGAQKSQTSNGGRAGNQQGEDLLTYHS